MAASRAFGSTTASRPFEKPNLLKVSRQAFLKNRLHVARLMRDFQASQQQTGECSTHGHLRIFSTREIDNKWTDVYRGVLRYVTLFAYVLDGYLAALDIEAGPMDTPIKILEALWRNAEEMKIFGVKKEVKPILQEIAPFFNQQPNNNMEKAAFVEYFQSMACCLPTLQPIEAQEKVEIYLGRRLHPDKLLNTPHDVETPDPETCRAFDVWRPSQDSSTVLTSYSFSLKWQQIQNVLSSVLGYIASWKVAVSKEVPQNMAMKTVFLMPRSPADPVAIKNFLDAAERDDGPPPAAREPLGYGQSVDMFYTILAASENIRMRLEVQASTSSAPWGYHGFQSRPSCPNEASGQPFRPATYQPSEGGQSSSQSDRPHKRRHSDSDDDAPSRKKQA